VRLLLSASPTQIEEILPLGISMTSPLPTLILWLPCALKRIALAMCGVIVVMLAPLSTSMGNVYRVTFINNLRVQLSIERVAELLREDLKQKAIAL